MIQNPAHSQLQQPTVLVCPIHNEVIKGFCLFATNCEERLMCRSCRRNHDSLHLNFYEELDDLFNGKLVNDVRRDYDTILKKIDKQNTAYENNSRALGAQVDYIYKEIQTYVLQKLLQTRDMLIGNINEKLEKNSSIRQNLVATLNDISRTFERISNSKFNLQATAEDMIKSICNAQILRDVTNNDPELQKEEIIGFNPDHLANPNTGNLFQQIKNSLDQICQDISSSFVPDRSGRLPSVPKGSLLSGGLVARLSLPEEQSLIMSMDMPHPQSERGWERRENSRGYGVETRQGEGFHGRRHEMLSQDDVDMSRRMYNDRQSDKYGSFGLPRKSPFNKAQGDLIGRHTPKYKSTPSKILELFQTISQEEGVGGRNGDGREALENQLMGMMREEKGQTYNMLMGLMERQKGGSNFEERRGSGGRPKGKLLEYNDRITTNHKQIMFGGLTYVAPKEHLVTAGTEGYIQIANMKNMQSILSFKAHNTEILRMLYIPEKDLLLSAALDGTISVWDYKQKCKLLHQFKEHKAPVYALDYLYDTDLIISGGEDETIRMWNINTCKQQHAMRTTNSKIGSICKLGRAKKIAVGFDKGHINIITIGQVKKVAYTIKAHNTFVVNLAVINEQNLLISCADESVKIWRLFDTKGEFARQFSQNGTMLRGFLIFQEKDLLISNHDDNKLRLWSISTGKKLEEYHDKTFGESMVAMYNRDEIATANLKEVTVWVVNS